MELCSICLFVTDISISIMSLRLIHIISYVRSSILLKSEKYSVVCIIQTTFVFMHSSVDKHLGWFHLLAVVNNLAKNIGVQISLSDTAFSNFGDIPRSEITGSYGNFFFFFLIFVVLPYCFPVWLHHFTFPPTAHEGSISPRPQLRFYTSFLSSRMRYILMYASVQFSQFSRSVVSDSLRPHELQHARLPCPLLYNYAH